MTSLRGAGPILRSIVLATLIIGVAGVALSRPNVLRQRPVNSPDSKRGANLEWEDVGFVGVLRMILYDGRGNQTATVEVPQVAPQPASLEWLDNEWVACGSFLGENAAGFLYVHAPTEKGYLIEILDPKGDGSWQVSYATSDKSSTGTIMTVTIGKSSIFPVFLTGIPVSETGFFDAKFASRLRGELDRCLQWKRSEGISHIELLSDHTYSSGRGGLVVARMGQRPEVVYFRAGAGVDSAANMVASLRREPLREEMAGHDRFVVEWQGDGPRYRVAARDTATTGVAVQEGEFPGATDTPPPVKDSDDDKAKKDD